MDNMKLNPGGIEWALLLGLVVLENRIQDQNDGGDVAPLVVAAVMVGALLGNFIWTLFFLPAKRTLTNKPEVPKPVPHSRWKPPSE